MKNQFKIVSLAIGILFTFSLAAFAQQLQQKTPVVTAEDVLRVSRGTSPSNIPTGNAAKRQTTEANIAAKTEPQKSDDRFIYAERLWNERLQKAQQVAQEFQRRADSTELEINRLNNILFSAERRSANTQNRLNAEILDLRREKVALRKEANAAQDDVNALLDEGRTQGFRIYTFSTRGESGAFDAAASRALYNELKTELEDAQRRAEVLQLRTSDVNRRLLLNAGMGDQFHNYRLLAESKDAQDELDEVDARILAINQKIDALRQQARRAGFRLE
jgi:hypothetical protein